MTDYSDFDFIDLSYIGDDDFALPTCTNVVKKRKNEDVAANFSRQSASTPSNPPHSVSKFGDLDIPSSTVMSAADLDDFEMDFDDEDMLLLAKTVAPTISHAPESFTPDTSDEILSGDGSNVSPKGIERIDAVGPRTAPIPEPETAESPIKHSGKPHSTADPYIDRSPAGCRSSITMEAGDPFGDEGVTEQDVDLPLHNHQTAESTRARPVVTSEVVPISESDEPAWVREFDPAFVDLFRGYVKFL